MEDRRRKTGQASGCFPLFRLSAFLLFRLPAVRPRGLSLRVNPLYFPFFARERRVSR